MTLTISHPAVQLCQRVREQLVERRCAFRDPKPGGYMAVVRQPNWLGGKRQLVPVRLLDVSNSGMGLFSPIALPMDCTLSLCETSMNGWNWPWQKPWEGTIVRCESTFDGYRIGVTFSDRCAA